MSTVTAFTPIAERSDATPGLWNSRFQTVQDNLVSLNTQVTTSAASVVASEASLVGWNKGSVTTQIVSAQSITGRSFDSGGFAFHVAAYGGSGDGSTDNATAIQSARSAAVAAGGGRILFGPGVWNTSVPPDFDNTTGITLEGPSAPVTSSSAAKLVYTGLGASAIRARSSTGFWMRDLQLVASRSTFTGDLVDLSHSTIGNDAALFGFERVFFSGVSSYGSARAALFLEDAIHGVVRRCNFATLPIGLLGRSTSTHYSNAIEVTGNHFASSIGSIPIRDPGQAWGIRHNTFEALANGQAGAVECRNATANALTIAENWCGDVTSGGTWVHFSGNGLVLANNYLSGGSFGLVLANGATGVAATGNEFTSPTAAGMQFLGAADGVVVTGNRFTSTTTPVLGLTSFTHTHLQWQSNSGGTQKDVLHTLFTSVAPPASAAVVLDNDRYIYSLNTSAAAKVLLGMDSSNSVRIDFGTLIAGAGVSAGYATINVNGTGYKIQLFNP